MNETSFVHVRVIRANDGTPKHEMHEVSLETVLSCVPSCTDLETKSCRKDSP
jgi:hypothetical protein